MRRTILITALSLLTFAAGAHTVKGRVTDAEGKPIVGAFVTVPKSVGTDKMKGTITDLNGEYAIEVAKKDYLNFGYIGMQSTVIAVDGRETLHVTLQKEDAQPKEPRTLYIVDGVVTPKADFDALKPEQVKNMNIVSGIDKVVVATTNRADDVKVLAISGKPKSTVEQIGVKIEKRGEGSVVIDERLNGTVMRVVKVDSKENDIKALVVVKKSDGTIVVDQNNGDSFNPQQIKTISVLKDKSAQEFAKYGDISNGVVVIELK